MDINGIRTDLKDLLAAHGWQATEYVPADVAGYPAAIVGVPEGLDAIVYNTSLGLAQVSLPITLAVGITTWQDMQLRQDIALSTNVDGSVIDLLRAMEPTEHIRKLQVTAAGNIRAVTVGPQDPAVRALAADVNVTVYAPK